MPRFLTSGDLIIGYGREPFDATRSIAQECNTIRPGCLVALSDGTIVAETGTNQLRANGREAWALLTPVGNTLDSFGRTTPNRGPDAVGPDGAICLRPPSNAFAEVLEPNGNLWRLADVDIFDVQLLGQGLAIWRERRNPQKLQAKGITVEQPEGDYGWARLIALGDRYALLYQSFSGGALVFDGHIVADGVDFFRSDAIFAVFLNEPFTKGFVKIAWSTGAGEIGVTPPPLTIPLAKLATLPLIADRLRGTSPPAPTGPTMPPHEPTPPVPTPPAIPTPPPPDMSALVNILSITTEAFPLLKEMRALANDGDARGWPDDIQAQHSAIRGKLLRVVAWGVFQTDQSWGLLRKDGGAHATRADGVKHSTDILVYRPTMALVDVFNDRSAQWNPLNMNDPNNVRAPEFWIQPVAEPGVSVPVPVPVPVPTPVPVPLPIPIPSSTFAFGDGLFRVLYGPEQPNGTRKIAGLIDEQQVARLEAMLEYADANRPKEP